ncbi:MAG: Nif3-like dinuclear metal center hexameric protein [Pseudomonadota bacterium]
MSVTVGDIILLMETIAPSGLAEKWDNSGLQLGKRNWPVRKIVTALDPGPEVIAEATRLKADLLITHHPLLFAPLKSIDLDTPTGTIIARAIEHHLCIYAAHTNLDSVADGLNDMLACRLALRNIRALQPSFFSPEGSSIPALPQGLGRIGELSGTATLKAFAYFIKNQLSLDHVTLTGDPELQVSRVAICTGSGSGLFDAFYASGAQVYVSGDFRYHDARTAEMNQVGLVDIGHFASEHLMVAALASRLRAECDAHGFPVIIHACEIEKNPFVIL